MLKLKDLYLKNFMSIKEAQLDLSDKVVVISGPNASGKSSVIDAIAICLSPKKRSSSYQDYVRQGEEFSKIILNCDINEEPVKFDVQLNLVKGTSFQLTLTYQNKEYVNKEADEIIQSFGLNYYSDLIFTMQNEMDITALTPTQRAVYLQKLLNFDFAEQKQYLSEEIEQCSEILKEISVQIPNKKQSIELLSTLENKKQNISKEELALIEKDLQLQQELLKQALEEEEEYKQANFEIQNLNQQITSLNVNLLDINHKYENAQNVLNSKATLKEDLNTLETTLQKTLETLNKNTDALKNAEQAIEEFKVFIEKESGKVKSLKHFKKMLEDFNG